MSVAVSKRISKIVESEGKAEKNSLKAAIQELKGIQRMQRVAVKVNRSFYLSVVVGIEVRSFSSERRRKPPFTPHTSNRFKNITKRILPS